MAMSSILSKPLGYTLHGPITKQPTTRPTLRSSSSLNLLLPSATNHEFRYLTSVNQSQRKKRMGTKCNGPSVPSPVPFNPPAGSSGPGKGWLIGIVLSVILPFLKMGKWGPLLFYKNQVDMALQRVEDTVEMLEEVADRVDKEAEKLYSKLPEGKLKKAVGMIEHVAEEAAKDAHLLDSAIDKVQEIEGEAENHVKATLSKTGKPAEAAKAK